MVECELPKLNMRVRFPLPAPSKKEHTGGCVLFFREVRSGIEPLGAHSAKKIR